MKNLFAENRRIFHEEVPEDKAQVPQQSEASEKKETVKKIKVREETYNSRAVDDSIKKSGFGRMLLEESQKYLKRSTDQQKALGLPDVRDLTFDYTLDDCTFSVRRVVEGAEVYYWIDMDTPNEIKEDRGGYPRAMQHFRMNNRFVIEDVANSGPAQIRGLFESERDALQGAIGGEPDNVKEWEVPRRRH